MHKSANLIVFSGILCLLLHTSSAYAQHQARAEITNAAGVLTQYAIYRAGIYMPA